MTLGTFRPNPSDLVAGPAGAMWTWATASVRSTQSERYTLSEPPRHTILDRLSLSITSVTPKNSKPACTTKSQRKPKSKPLWPCPRTICSDNTTMNITVDPKRNAEVLAEMGATLARIENDLYRNIGDALVGTKPGRDRGQCDAIFGIYTHALLRPYVKSGFASRAAAVGNALAHAVLNIERTHPVEFHKGALFHDTALAHFLSGDEDQYEYFLAMAGEEDVKTSGGTHKRDSLNLRSNALTGQTIGHRLQFACDLLNGTVAGHPANYAFVTGAPTITVSQLDGWRQQLDSLHQFEFLRFVHDLYVFVGVDYPDYQPVKDNPFVMLRLAKALSHLAQWVESCLTRWQTGAIHGALRKKLDSDPSFGPPLRASAMAEGAHFPGNSPQGAAVDTELQNMLTTISGAAAGSPRHWRLLRILYIARNSTAHVIEPNLAMYTNPALLLNLIQTVFTSVFAICQLKGKQMP